MVERHLDTVEVTGSSPVTGTHGAVGELDSQLSAKQRMPDHDRSAPPSMSYTSFMAIEKKRNSPLVKMIKEYRLEFAAATALLYVLAIILLIFVFPDVSNLWVSIFVLISGLTASITTLGDLLVSAEESNKTDVP